MMNETEIWSNVSGHDTSGTTILSDIKRLQDGEMGEDEASELMHDLVRDKQPSTAGYAAIPFLIKPSDNLSLKTQGEMVHAACLILGLASSPKAPKISDEFALNFTDDVRKAALQRLFLLASQENPESNDVISIASAALLLKGRRDLYDFLTDNYK